MAKKITLTQVVKEQKKFLDLIKKMPKITNRSTKAQLDKLYDFSINTYRLEIEPQSQELYLILRDYLYQDPNYKFMSPIYGERNKKTTLSARGWHKEHYNYNKAEKWELPPSLRRTPARNVTKTGAKRKRATTITKYKR